jgi:xanthine dehydrogenase molybdenum-binding subunit
MARVLKVISANDVGMAVNPLGLQGQVEGGVMMGLGNALTEEFIMDNGYVVTDHLARYRIPGIMLTPEITSIIVEHPTGRSAVQKVSARSAVSHHTRHHKRDL